MLVALSAGRINAFAECLDELSLANDAFDALVFVEDDHDAAGDAEQAFGRFLQGIIRPHRHVFVVQCEVSHFLSHEPTTCVAGFGSCFVQLS